MCLLNSLFKAALVYVSDARGWSEQNLIYQVSAQSYKVVTNYAFFILSLVICCTVHTTSALNQNYYVSSIPMPLKNGNFIVFSMADGGGGGGGVRDSVCDGGGGGGGFDG